MDIQKDYSCVEHNGRVFSKQFELESDYQEAIPAYCDDIFRVVKCVSRSFITSWDISYNEVKVFGKTEICLTYYNEKSELCYADFEEDFNKTVAVDELSDSAFISADIYDKYTNFRVINQRRIDVHNSSVLKLNIYDKIKCPQICSCENAKLRREKFKIADVVSSDISRIEFDEEFTLTSGNAPINRIISYSAFVSLSETKVIKDKALIKAVVNAEIIYTTDENESGIEKIQYSFNASKIIESLGINDEDIALSNVSLGSMFVKGKSADGDKVNTIDIFGELSVNTVFIRESEQEYITDGYIPKTVADNTFSDYKISTSSGFINDNKLINASFALPDDVKKVCGLSISFGNKTVKNGRLTVTVIINALCANDSGELISVSSSDEFEISVNDGNEEAVSININSSDYTISERNTLDLRLNLQISVYSINNKTVKILNDIVPTDSKSDSPALTVYFAKSDENVWDIAKNFSSDVEMIINENSLKNEILDSDKVLIIPGV